jgi:hypothetical protein
LHVNTFANGIASFMLESSYNSSAQRAIGYFRVKNTATGDMFNFVLRKNGAVHEMLQSAFDAGSGLWREFIYYNYTTRKYEMRNGVMDAEFLNSGKFLISSAGNTGIGVVNPLEKLDVNGAVRIANTASSNSGTIRFDGFNFYGYNGASWLQLDNVANPITWIMIPNPMPAPMNNPQLYPVLPPSTVTYTLPGNPNNSGWFYVTDMAAPGLYPHQLTFEAMTFGGASASQLYEISQAPLQPVINFSAGINSVDMTYKLNFGPVLIPSAQSDGSSMLRAFPTGIIDLPNQSRVRAYQSAQGWGQIINPSIWTPVNFDIDSPLSSGYDEQNEFTIAPSPFAPVPPEAAFFVATATGYYQVNSRVEFNLDYWQGGPVQVNQNSYVSIAIYIGPGVGAGVSYAQGNNLGIGYLSPQGPILLVNNNAPNVSDVVYMMAGQVLSIWVYQSAITPLNLIPGPSKVYVSIHKVS